MFGTLVLGYDIGMSDNDRALARFLAREHQLLISRFGADSEQSRAAEEVLRECGRDISLSDALQLLKIINGLPVEKAAG